MAARLGEKKKVVRRRNRDIHRRTTEKDHICDTFQTRNITLGKREIECNKSELEMDLADIENK